MLSGASFFVNAECRQSGPKAYVNHWDPALVQYASSVAHTGLDGWPVELSRFTIGRLRSVFRDLLTEQQTSISLITVYTTIICHRQQPRLVIAKQLAVTQGATVYTFPSGITYAYGTNAIRPTFCRIGHISCA